MLETTLIFQWKINSWLSSHIGPILSSLKENSVFSRILYRPITSVDKF